LLSSDKAGGQMSVADEQGQQGDDEASGNGPLTESSSAMDPINLMVQVVQVEVLK
jgi:hypothetical protein